MVTCANWHQCLRYRHLNILLGFPATDNSKLTVLVLDFVSVHCRLFHIHCSHLASFEAFAYRRSFADQICRLGVESSTCKDNSTAELVVASIGLLDLVVEAVDVADAADVMADVAKLRHQT